VISNYALYNYYNNTKFLPQIKKAFDFFPIVGPCPDSIVLVFVVELSVASGVSVVRAVIGGQAMPCQTHALPIAAMARLSHVAADLIVICDM